MRRVIAGLIATVVSITAGQADPDAANVASQLFEQGKAARNAGDYATACDKFAKSIELDPTLRGAELSLGDCAMHAGHYLDAQRIFEAVATKFERDKDGRAKYAREQAALASGKLAIVIIKLPDPIPVGTSVKLGARDVTVAKEIRERVDPGELAIVVSAPDHSTFERREKLAEGATSTIDVVLPIAATPPPIAPASPPPVALGERRRSRVYLAWGLAGSGAAVLTTAAVFAVVAKHDYSEITSGPGCSQHPLVCDSSAALAISHAQTLGDVATGFAVAGLALVAGAAVTYFTAPREQLVVVPSASATGVGLVVGRAF